ncbi:MAG: NFACT family protein [Thermaerobacter sp.]|nr:NFACT family protein [Thermaerobacter sp.]
MTDWIALQALARELGAMRGARIDAVHLDARRIVLTLRERGSTLHLALETRQDLPFLYLLRHAPERQKTPGAVLQLLRRQLEGARLEGAYAPFGERLLALCLSGRDRFGDERALYLCGEFFGAHADVVLAAEDHVLFVLHGRRLAVQDAYALPGPKPPPSRTLRRALIAPGDLIRRIAQGDFAPTIEEREGKVHDAWSFPWSAEGALRPAEGMLKALSEVAQGRLDAIELRELRGALQKRLQTQRERALRTLQKKQDEFAETRDLPKLLRQGEALKLHLHDLPQGLQEAHLPDPEEPETVLEITLDPNLSASENMARIFKRYQKLRTRAAHLGQEIEDLAERVAVLWDQLLAVERAEDAAALRALRSEILPQDPEEGQKAQRSGPLRFYTPGGHEVLVGRSAKENDALTRSARPSDLWFHTKDRQGAHCILRPLPGRSVGAPDRLEAALLAAFYSKQRGGSQVPVDYTFVRHVRRLRGAAPGFVLYDHHETLFVTPEASAIEAIRRRRGSSRS